MDTIWTIWVLVIIVSFALLEQYAFKHDKNTLSRFVVNLTKAWPLFPFIFGLIMGGLAVHFFWHFCPDGLGTGG